MPTTSRPPAVRTPARRDPIRLLKPVLFAAALGPFIWLVHAGFNAGLGTDPVETIASVTGTSALVVLFATLAVTPVRRLTGWNPLIRVRRMLGLFAFFYAVLHAVDYFVFDQSLSVPDIVEDVIKHPWVALGFGALVMILALAVTSTNGWIRRLGGKRWNRLHRLIYPAAIAASTHFFLAVKRDVSVPLAFAVVLVVLLGVRVAVRTRPAGPARARRPDPPPLPEVSPGQ